MPFDAITSLRIINNQRLMLATHRGEYRDLRGALAITSDAPDPRWNCLEGFSTDDRHLDGLLDVGFSLLRAFDRPAAARLTPLDRPRTIARQLERRGLRPLERETSMCFTGDIESIPTNDAVTVRRIDADDAAAFAAVEAQARGLARKDLLLGAALANVLDPDHWFYLASVEGQPVGTTLVVHEDETAGIYAVATLKAHRRTGVASTLVARAVRDARLQGAATICLETLTGSDAMHLYAGLGFTPAHESTLYVEPERI